MESIVRSSVSFAIAVAPRPSNVHRGEPHQAIRPRVRLEPRKGLSILLLSRNSWADGQHWSLLVSSVILSAV